MNRDTLAGQWKQLTGAVKKRWARLTDDDLLNVEGNVEKFVGSAQERQGSTRRRTKAESGANRPSALRDF